MSVCWVVEVLVSLGCGCCVRVFVCNNTTYHTRTVNSSQYASTHIHTRTHTHTHTSSTQAPKLEAGTRTHTTHTTHGVVNTQNPYYVHTNTHPQWSASVAHHGHHRGPPSFHGRKRSPHCCHHHHLPTTHDDSSSVSTTHTRHTHAHAQAKAETKAHTHTHHTHARRSGLQHAAHAA